MTSSFTNLKAQFDFSSISKSGAMTLTADEFTLTIDSQLTIEASGITLTPDQSTILHIDHASVTLAQLNDLSLTVDGLDIFNNGFSIATGVLNSSNSGFNLGGILGFSSAPKVTLTDISYTIGGTLGGTVTLGQTDVTLDLGGAVTASATFSGSYNIKTGTLSAELDNFSLNLAGFISVNGTSLVFSYNPSTTDDSATFFIGGTGLTVLMGSGSGGSSVGVEVTSATFALAIYKTKGPSSTITYALDANGGLSLVGLPGNPVSLTATNVEVRANNHGAVDEQVNIDSTPADAKHLFFTVDEQSMMATGVTLTVGSFVKVTGDFGFKAFADPTDNTLTDVTIAANNVNALIGTSSTNLTINGASLAVLILPSKTYALVANGGTDLLNGVSGVSLSASGLSVKINNTGLDPSTLSGLPGTLDTPDGTVPLDFSGLTSDDVIAVEGTIDLNIAGFVSLHGDFGFQTFVDASNNTDIILAAQHISATIGTATTYLSIDEASLQMMIVTGASGGYALLVNGGTDTLHGVPGLDLSSSNLIVRVNTLGADPTSFNAPATVEVPGDSINIDFGGIGATNIKDIEGDLTLTIANFITLQGSFGFQAFTDANTGLTDIAIGATGLTATLGTSTVNVQIDGAQLGLLVIAGTAGAPAKYALIADGGTDTLNGIPGLQFIGDGLSVKVNNLGVDPSALPGLPTAVHTSGGDVALDFAGMGAGASMSVQGTITLSVLDFVSLHGSFAFQTFTDLVSGKTDIAFAATGIDATLAVGGVSLTISGASLGVVVLTGAPGSPGTYALVANGGVDTLSGIPGLSLSASGLSVRINNTGADLMTRIGSTTLTTPGGDVSLDFTGLGTGNIKDIEGNISLSIDGFVSLSGDFGFQQFTDVANGTSEILVGGKNISATLGTSTTNVTIDGASLGILLLPGTVGNPGSYALFANGGTDTLNGVPGLTLSASGLTVKVNNGVSAALLADGAQVVHTSGGDVTLNFNGLGAGNVIDVEGTVTVNVSGFVSLTGSFVFTKRISAADANVTEIVVAATGVNAFLGTADQSVGISVNDAELGLVIYQNITGHTTTYALHATAGIQVVGLPADIGFTGTIGVDINTTGAAVTETVTTADGDVNINFTDGTNGSADQRNIQAFAGHLTLNIGPQGSPLFSLFGDFSFAKATVNGLSELMIGAANVGATNITPDGGSSPVSLGGGTLGLILYTKASGNTTVNAGYALTASATVTAGGGGSSGSLTVTVLRNTTTNAINETVTAGGVSIPLTFTSKQVAVGTKAYQAIALSNASLSIDNTLIITAGSAGSTNSGGVNTKTLTGVTLTLQDPTSGTVLFSITAASASYSTVNAGVTFDGMKWVKGGTEVVLTNISLSIAGYVVFTGTVNIKHFTDATNAVVTSFNFSSASVTFLVNNQPMVTVAGTFAFSYSSATGFAMTNATITDFSFLGQSLGGANGGGVGLLANPPPHTLGPITFGTPSISLSSFSLHLDGTLSVKVTISDTLASINNSVVSVTAKNLSGSFDFGLKLDLANPLSPPTNITASGFTLKIGQLDIVLNVTSNISLTLTALNITIDPTAGPTNDLLTIGGSVNQPGLSATLNVNGIMFTGGASNFAITGDGSFVAGNNFSVTLGFGQGTTSDSIKWPSWLPIKNVQITLLWPGNNFNADPKNFQIDFSADISIDHLGGIPLSIEGLASHVVIDVGKLAAGEFPIVSIGALGVQVSGNLFGGTVSGGMVAGIVRYDSTGAIVDASGNVVATGKPGVGAINSVFYGGIDAQFSLGNLSGFQIRIGLTQYGPLSIYVEGSLPTGIILDPNSGLAINNFRGSVSFGVDFPDINLSDPISASDALQLRKPGFSPPNQLTLEQWQAQLAAQVAKLYAGPTQADGWSNLGKSSILFSAGATLFDAYATENAFKVDADILFDTSGKFLVIGSATFGNSLTLGVKMYADLSPIFQGTNDPVNILFLMDYPTQSGAITTPPILSIYGVLQFQYVNNVFQINIAGEADLNVMGGFKASLVGNMSMTFSATTFQLTIFDVKLNVSYLGDVGNAAGSLTIQKNASGGLDVWGAFVMDANLAALENVGIHGGGQVYFELNTTTQVQPVTLHLANNIDVPINLQPTSFSFFLSGGATFDQNGQQIFSISGTLAVNLTIDTSTATPTFTLTIFLGGVNLVLGPAGDPMFNFTVNGLIFVDQNGFAAKITATLASSPLTGFTINAKFLLVMNTTGETITYKIPKPLPTPGAQNVGPIMGPDFSSPDVLATVSYESTDAQGNRIITIPNGPPPSGTTNFANWTPTSQDMYFVVLGRGKLTVSSLVISGTLNILATYSPVTGEINFSLQVNASLNLTVNGTNLFSFSVLGFIQIDNNGLVAALQIQRSAGTSLPGGLGFTMTATFMLEINTTNNPVTVPGTSITVPKGAMVAASGSLSIPGFSISGEFDLTVSSTYLSVYVRGTVNVLGVTFSVQGYAGIYYDNDPGFALSLTLSIGTGDPSSSSIYPVASLGNKFVITGTFILQINTCSGTRNFTDPVTHAITPIASGFVISVPTVSVYLFGLNLTGSVYFGLTSGGLNIHLVLGLDFFKAHFNFDGYVNSNGTFSITASASFEYDWSIKIFSGEIYAYFSVTLSNTGFSASAGCGIHVDGIGSLSAHASVYIDSNHFKMDVGVDIGICDVTVTIDFGSEASPPAPPPTPKLGEVLNGVLVLYFGQDVGSRGASFGALAAENYALTDPTHANGTVVVTALGYTQTFTGVSSIVVHNTLGGNDTITVSNDVTESMSITLGDGNNTITTGGGYTTINDYGTGSNTIHAGSGGGIYYGGLEGGTTPYANKGESAIYTSGNFVVNESGYATYSLNSTTLQYGNYTLDLNGVATVTLNAVSGNGAHTFSLFGWAGTVNINGQGNNNTINVNPSGGFASATFVLTNSQLVVTNGGVTGTFNLSDIQTANLTGNAKGANTYTVTGWTGNGSIKGPSGSTNTVIAANNVNYSLTDTSLGRSGLPTLQLQGIQNVTLTGGASANIFTIQNWTGNAILNGVGGNETFNIFFTAGGNGTVTISDNALASNDILNLYTGASTTITANQLKVGSQLVNYSSIKTLHISGTAAGLTYNIQSTNSGTGTTIDVTGTGNIFNIGSTAGLTPAQPGEVKGILGLLILNGSGHDVLNVDDSGNPGNPAGRIVSLNINAIIFSGLGTISFVGMSNLTISLGQGGDAVTVLDTFISASPSPVIIINGNGGDDSFRVEVAQATMTINGGDGVDTFSVFSNTAALNLNGGAGNDVFNIMASVASGQQSYNQNALVNVDGGTGVDALNIHATALNDSITIDGMTFVNIGLDIAFGNITNYTVYGNEGSDIFYVKSVVVNTLLVNDTFGVSPPSFDDTFYIGWRGDSVPGSLSGILAPLTIQCYAGFNVAYVDDSANTAGQTFTLTPSTMTSTAMGANGIINFFGLKALHVSFGSGDDALVINDLFDGATTVDGGAGNNSAALNFTYFSPATDLTLLNFQTASLSVVGDFRGSLTNAGTFTAITIGGGFADTATLNAGSIGTMTIGAGFAGLLNVTGGIGSLDIDGYYFNTGVVNAASIDTMTVGQDFAGSVNVPGAVGSLSIDGSVVNTGSINAGSLDAMTVGGDFAGVLNVTNLLNTLSIGGGSPGKIVAGAVNFITVKAGFGNKVFQVIEGGIERQIQAMPVAGGTLDSSIRFEFIYDSSGAGDPQLAMLITNGGTVVPHSFNVWVAVIGSNAQFDLALVMANAATGLSNLTVSGDLLFSANSAELNFLQLSSAPVGVVLPFDNITGVEIAGVLPIGEINVAGIEGIAFGILENSKGQAVPILGDLGSVGKPQVLWNLLGSQATLLAATDTLTVTFNESHNLQVFAQCNNDFTLEYVMTLTDSVNDGAPINASFKITPGKTPVISNVAFTGEGASIDSRFGVANITSTGSIGDITVRKGSLGNVSATSIFGNINVLLGSINGTIVVSGDIGQFTYDKNGVVNGVTTISAKLGIDGQIIVRGNLISTVKAATFSGVLAVQGNIGVLSPAVPVGPGALTRFGGIAISGNANGQIIALGNVFGDLSINGTFSGRIAVEGTAAAGLDAGRFGILGNVRIGKFAASTAIVSGGMIGDLAGGTSFKSGAIKSGVLAADGAITLAKNVKVNAGNFFANSSETTNGATIDAIFTDESSPLQFDTGGPLAGLALIEADLGNLDISGGNLVGTIP